MSHNVEVFETEWRIASAGGKVFELPYGAATRDCAWPSQAMSHLAVIKAPHAFDPEHPMPCGHHYEYIAPAGLDHGFTGETRRELAMRLPLRGETTGSERLKLERVESEADWSLMSDARVEVESAFGVEPGRARRMVDHIRRRKRFLTGEWYLARSGEAVVGGVGLVVFEAHSGRLGRLQDVDILPSFQGRGLGNELMAAAIHEARRTGCSAICLRADADDWPNEWYARLGFATVGEWLRF